jgi:dGTPase
MTQQSDREVRRSGDVDRISDSDVRSPFQRDRDRILYCDYFRRLAGVTQVASAVEGGVFHNRLTHSLKVAQVARRLAELLLHKYLSEWPDLHNCLNPDVVEAAALAHDLGHPPFGHVADERLCELAEIGELEDGYEGNAQTFRIATRLSVRRNRDVHGLDLTRATLAAISKYPWLRARGPGADTKRRKKFSFFDDDCDAADFATDGRCRGVQSLECQVMDLADAITYSVHDLEDFYRAGLIPIERLVRSEHYRRNFLKRWQVDKPDDPHQQQAQLSLSWPLIENLLQSLLSEESETGTKSEAALLDAFRSVAISHFLRAVLLTGSQSEELSLSLPNKQSFQIEFLQRLVFDYVILNPRLATQQAGQLKIIDELYGYFRDSLNKGRIDRLPLRFRDEAAELGSENARSPRGSRLAVDIIATLTEPEAIALFKRVGGYDGGSVLDQII